MAEKGREVLLKAQGRTLSIFREDAEREWKAPFYFIQGADPQFGLMKAYAIGDCDSGGDEWGEELQLTKQAVLTINKLNPKPKFFILCGDLIHGMPVATEHGKVLIQQSLNPVAILFKKSCRTRKSLREARSDITREGESGPVSNEESLEKYRAPIYLPVWIENVR